MLRWRLKEVMARHNIKNQDLARKLKMRTASTSLLRNATTIPAIGGEKLSNLCRTLSDLAGEEIQFSDLYEYIPEKETISA